MELKIIQKKIFELRQHRIILDFDLAILFNTPTKSLNLAVKRNIERFPDDFMFQLTKKEWENLRFQFETSKQGGRRYLPYAFTEHGVTMLANLLRSDIAIKMSIAVVRAFITLRQMVTHYSVLEQKIKSLEKKYNKQFKNIYEALHLLMKEQEQKIDWENRERIGYRK